MSITKKQKEVYDFIKEYSEKNRYAPTQREILEYFGFKSFGSVQRYLKYLTEAGYLESNWNARRGLVAIKEESTKTAHPSNFEEIPLFGDVAAGIPILAMENPDNTLTVPSNMIRPGHRHYALTVSGDSMIEDGIFEGDTLICKYQQTANRGETVIALIDGEATVKKYQPKGKVIELHPANSTMKPIIIDEFSGEFKLAGVVVGLLRTYL